MSSYLQDKRKPTENRNWQRQALRLLIFPSQTVVQ
jgi:hypothetical protein